MGIVLVVGATGSFGKRVVKKLQEQVYQVRSIVRDINEARNILGNDVDLVVADITKLETLTSLVMGNIQAVIYCTSVKAEPILGDSPNEEKKYQGVNLYQSETVNNSLEEVEYQGIRNLVEAASQYLPKSRDKLIFDFTNPSAEIHEVWGSLDDVVMGGVSQSYIQFLSDGALFTGNISTKNSGGFASVRTRNFSPILDLSKYEGIDLRVKGDGKRYKFILRAESKWDGIGYSYSFDTVSDIWTTVRVPFADLVPVFRARIARDYLPVDNSNIYSLQLMLSKFEYDGKLNPRFSPGNFNLQVESIKAYGADLPQFVLLSPTVVSHLNILGDNLSKELPEVKSDEQLGSILLWALKGENALRKSGIPYTIIRHFAFSDKRYNKELIIDKGDNIQGRMSYDNIAELCVSALQETKDSNIIFDVKECNK